MNIYTLKKISNLKFSKESILLLILAFLTLSNLVSNSATLKQTNKLIGEFSQSTNNKNPFKKNIDNKSQQRELHVSKNGSDTNQGTEKNPLLTIQAASNIAKPGTIIIVHGGIYRESVVPKSGGLSNDQRIIYAAAEGENVIIKGSEVIKGWDLVKGNIWKKTISNSFFGNFNPYTDVMQGHWFFPEGKTYHTGVVYLNGKWMKEAQSIEELDKKENDSPLWYSNVDKQTTTIFAQFPNVNPNKEIVEINVRQTIFFPEKSDINYITVKGFDMQQAATPWAPPTQPQKGLIGSSWSKGWIIENNKISYSKSSGICFGRPIIDTTQVMSAYGMIAALKYASEHNQWNKEKIGHHIIRNNQISNCGQAGIVGNMGASFSLIEGNEISEINTLESFNGMEQGGIKLHGGVDVIIQDNCVYNTGKMARGIWFDWLGQGSIIRNNLIFNTTAEGIYLEVNHGPILCANNIVLSNISFTNLSRGSALVHNLFKTQIIITSSPRVSPYLKPHDTKFAGYHINSNPGDDRFFNNIFASSEKESMRLGASIGDSVGYVDKKLPLKIGGNLYINKAIPYKIESNPKVVKDDNIDLNLVKRDDGFYIEWANNPEWLKGEKRNLITTDFLGETLISKAKYELPNGEPIIIDTDYFGKKRSKSNPTPGPFEGLSAEKKLIKIWPKN